MSIPAKGLRFLSQHPLILRADAHTENNRKEKVKR